MIEHVVGDDRRDTGSIGDVRKRAQPGTILTMIATGESKVERCLGLVEAVRNG